MRSARAPAAICLDPPHDTRTNPQPTFGRRTAEHLLCWGELQQRFLPKSQIVRPPPVCGPSLVASPAHYPDATLQPKAPCRATAVGRHKTTGRRERVAVSAARSVDPLPRTLCH
eukprot:7108568-Prymnesium_polylepis.1